MEGAPLSGGRNTRHQAVRLLIGEAGPVDSSREQRAQDCSIVRRDTAHARERGAQRVGVDAPVDGATDETNKTVFELGVIEFHERLLRQDRATLWPRIEWHKTSLDRSLERGEYNCPS
jgi:hypothetical protein